MTKIANSIFALLILLSGTIGICNAEPDRTIKYLMDEPVTMLDWGLFRFENYLNHTISKDAAPYTVSYSWGQNIIEIHRFLGTSAIINKRIGDLDQAKELCRREVKHVRALSNYQAFRNSFTHEDADFQSKKEPKNIVENLMKITSIKITAIYDKMDKKVVCRAPLLGKDIYFKE